MIEVCQTLANVDRLADWLYKVVRPHLRKDVSGYARKRLRVWLRTEPTLTYPTRLLPGLSVEDGILDRLKEMIEWDFDFCLVTYSGDMNPVGITPHRDACFADYEAYGLHVTGECRFDYWCDKESFGKSSGAGLVKSSDLPTHSLLLEPGQVIRFNCKNLHAATPSVGRWNLNFWKAKEGR